MNTVNDRILNGDFSGDIDAIMQYIGQDGEMLRKTSGREDLKKDMLLIRNNKQELLEKVLKLQSKEAFISFVNEFSNTKNSENFNDAFINFQ